MVDPEALQKVKEHYDKLKEQAKTDIRLKCLLVLSVFTGGDFEIKDLESLVYKYTHAVTSTCDHKEWIEALEKDYEKLCEQGFI